MRFEDLATESQAVIADVRDGVPRNGHPGLAWSRVPDLMRAGHAEATIRSLITQHRVWGWLALWCRGKAELVTLTPWAAAQLDSEIDERGADDEPFWVRCGQWQHPIHLPRQRSTVRMDFVKEFEEADRRPVYLLDEFTGEPVSLLGRLVKIDRRMGTHK